MTDGRSVLSSWQPESAMNEELIKENKIESNWMYRKYLTQNAKGIMEHNFREACNDTGYVLPKSAPSAGTYTAPYMFRSLNDPTQPIGYQDSDLKQLYLSKEQLNAKKVCPVITQDELIRRMK
jgi:hypothetical protein